MPCHRVRAFAQDTVLMKSFLLHLYLVFINCHWRFSALILWTVFLWSRVCELLRADRTWHERQIFVVEVFIRDKLVLVHLFLHARHIAIALQCLFTLNLGVKVHLVHHSCLILLFSLVRIILIVKKTELLDLTGLCLSHCLIIGHF